MTSMAADSVSTILVTCKQTRFHIESPNYRELDIEGLNITVTAGDKPSAKGKGKAKGEGIELLSNAKLRLKAGQRYALVGRNGSGKSTLLRAIAEKLIPGIPEETRISILQQTNATDADADAESAMREPPSAAAGGGGRTVLEEVIEKATAKDELEREITTLSTGLNSTDSLGALRAIRKIRHERMQKRLFLLDKEARLRSGTRGMQARKALVQFEKTVAEAAALNEQHDEEIPSETLQKETQEAADLLAELQIQIEPAKLADIESKAKKILAGLGFTETYMQHQVSSLSGGWAMRTALAIALLQETDILILDEPTNFLDLLGIIWLQRYLQSLEDTADPPTLILVSHDRDFNTLCTDLLILKDKGLAYFHGDLPTYESSQSERRQHLTRMKEAQDRQRAHMQETITRNMRQGKKADDDNKIRQAKSRQKRLDDRMGMQVSARGGRFKLNRDMAGWHFTSRAEIDIPVEERPVHVVLPDPPDLRFPGPLLSLENVSFTWPQAKPQSKLKATPTKTITTPTLQDINLTVHMGDRIGILGLNGTGKSTLVRLLVGESRPTRGSVTTHPRLRLGYYSQHAISALQSLGRAEPGLTALALLAREVAAGDGELDDGDLRGLLGTLGLPGRLASDTPVVRLSGGQLVRCELARLLWRRPQCLVLDEVTTHLDYETVAALREALRTWRGAVVLVSHDRWFVRGAVEGVVDTGEGDSEEEEEEDDDDEDGTEGTRRRVVYRLRAGKMEVLERGVQQFEEIMEKRVRKVMGS